uniref:Uncharacterized protein n=1 Tax=Meloidogyne enterolobii TaxID=390850 RepID=A0A6V7V9Y4_MELEN|nr:unnamed protein product [Meloidogyne enterolobii]
MTENNQSTSNVDDYQGPWDLINLQDGLNRSIRHINRKAQANFDAINRLANSVNLNSATVEAQIKSLVERIDRLDQFDNNSLEEIDGQQQLNRSERLNYTLIRPNPFVDENPENNNQIFTLTGITGLDVFSQESVSAFDKWSRRFRDYLAVMCGNMNEQQKLDRLRLALDDTPRDLYDKLSAAETATVEDALRALKYKLDSPQRKELAKRSLGLCKQREDESVTYSNLGPVQLKERLCEEFLDRLKPDLSFLIRLAGLSREKDLELVRTQAEELELLLKTHKGQAPEMFSQAIQAIERNPQMMSSSGQFNNNQNTRQLQEQRGFQQRNYPRRKTTAPMPNEGQKRFKGNWNNNPNNERKWNSRPEQLDSESLEIATEECREMIYRKKCKIGTLIEEDGLWHTNVKIDNSPRTWLLGSWDWKTVSSENCYLVPTKIFSKFGDKSITSPLGDIQDCSYLKGQCIMPDKTILMWKSSNDTNCEYKPMGP